MKVYVNKIDANSLINATYISIIRVSWNKYAATHIRNYATLNTLGYFASIDQQMRKCSSPFRVRKQRAVIQNYTKIM